MDIKNEYIFHSTKIKIFLDKAAPGMLYIQDIVAYLVYASHVITLAICAILHYLNKNMYKTSAYRITLKRRHTVSLLQHRFSKFVSRQNFRLL